jgi:NAD dependent epimerase/dehydratase
MRVLITGADGFIGSHLTELLLLNNVKVRAITYYNSFNYLGWLENIKSDKLEICSGDIRDAGFCRQIVKDIDIIYHLAALIAIPYSYQAPESYVDTNIKGTLNILQSALDNKVSRILVTSTSEVYGTAKYVPIDEIHPRQPQSPYSATKIAADAIAESFYRSFNLPVTIVRPFNTYGPHQSARAIIPAIIIQLLSGKKEIKLGSLHPTRDLVFVKDTVRGFLEIASNDKTIGTDFNIATGFEISIGELAQKLIGLINPKAKIISDEQRIRPEKSEVERLLGSNTKLFNLTGWKPSTTIDDGLKDTIKWFKIPENLKCYKSDAYNV